MEHLKQDSRQRRIKIYKIKYLIRYHRSLFYYLNRANVAMMNIKNEINNYMLWILKKSKRRKDNSRKILQS